jgi:hypothetical protein
MALFDADDEKMVNGPSSLGHNAYSFTTLQYVRVKARLASPAFIPVGE